MYYLKPGDVTVLGISGQMGNGKSTLTQVAVEEYGFVPQSLARHFKVDAVAKDGRNPASIFGPHKDPEDRDVLQKRGTEEGRMVYGEDVWLRHAEAHMFDLAEHGVKLIVVPDVRFPNEVRWVQSLGGKVYRVFGRKPEMTEGHESETALNGWSWQSPDGGRGFDSMLANSTTLEDLQRQMRACLETDYNLRRLLRTA